MAHGRSTTPERNFRVAVIEGDGIGPAIMSATERVITAACPRVKFYYHYNAPTYGGDRPTHKTPSLVSTMVGDFIEGQTYEGRSVLYRWIAGDDLSGSSSTPWLAHSAVLKGPMNTLSGRGHRSPNVRLREMLGAFAGVRQVRSLIPGHRYADVDLVTIRENMEGLYSGFELDGIDDKQAHIVLAAADAAFDGRLPSSCVAALKVVTPKACRRIILFAFRWARDHGRKKVTCVHKANILKKTDGLFLETFRELAKEFPDIEAEQCIVDAAAMKMVMDPSQFDVIVAPNLYGDILSDLAAGLVGGLGLAPGANLGGDIPLFEAVHGTAPDIAGKGIANPCSLILSGAQMLDHFGEVQAAELVRTAVAHVVSAGIVTGDLNWQMPVQLRSDPVSTEAMATAIIERIAWMRKNL